MHKHRGGEFWAAGGKEVVFGEGAALPPESPNNEVRCNGGVFFSPHSLKICEEDGHICQHEPATDCTKSAVSMLGTFNLL